MKKYLLVVKFVFQYPFYLVMGFIFMLLYAGFSGISITLALPLFDNIFISDRTITPIYTDFFTFSRVTTETIRNFFQKYSITFDKEILSLLWEEIKAIVALSEPWMLLKVISSSLLILILLKNVFYFTNRMMFVNLRGRLVVDLRNACYQNYLSQSYLFFNQNRVGDSIVRMVNDIDHVNNLFINSLYKIIRDICVVVIYALIAMKLNFRLFCVSLLILPTFAFSVNYIGSKVKKYVKRKQIQLSEMFSNIVEVLHSMRIVKAFCQEDFEYQKLNRVNNQYFQFWRRSEIYTSFALPLSETSSILIGIIILFLGGMEILNANSNFSFGSFIVFLLAVFSMMHPLKSMANDITDMKRGVVSVDRITEVLMMKSEIEESVHCVPKSDFTSHIEFKKVSFEYLKGVPVLQDCSFTIQKNQKIAFVGASGSGKTTIANLINRMYDVTSGEILLDDVAIKSIKIKDLRKLFGIVTQESILFSETIENNIKYGARTKKTIDDVIQACHFAYADEFIDHLPEKYQTKVLPSGSNLSGGQKQRLCIARAIIENPPILIFDEATSALDTDSEQKVQKAIDLVAGNRTVIVIAHRLSTILSADKIIVLDKGVIVGEGTHSKLINDCPKYKHFFTLQFNQN